jgi:hypothetical protein
MSEVLVPVYDFTAALASGLTAASKNASTPRRCGVWVQVSDGAMAVVSATDAYRASHVQVPARTGVVPDPDAPHVQLSRMDADRLLKALKATTDYRAARRSPVAGRPDRGFKLRVRVADGVLQVAHNQDRQDGMTLEDANTSGQDLLQLDRLYVPAASGGRIDVAGPELRDAATGLAGLPADHGKAAPGVTLTLPRPGERGVWVSRTDSPTIEARVLIPSEPASGQLAGAQVSFLPRYLTDAIRSTDVSAGKAVTLWLPHPYDGEVRRPVLFSPVVDEEVVTPDPGLPGHLLVPVRTR